MLSQCFDVAAQVHQVDSEIQDLLFGSGQAAHEKRSGAPASDPLGSSPAVKDDVSEAEIDAILNKIGSKKQLERRASKLSEEKQEAVN